MNYSNVLLRCKEAKGPPEATVPLLVEKLSLSLCKWICRTVVDRAQSLPHAFRSGIILETYTPGRLVFSSSLLKAGLPLGSLPVRWRFLQLGPPETAGLLHSNPGSPGGTHPCQIVSRLDEASYVSTQWPR